MSLEFIGLYGSVHGYVAMSAMFCWAITCNTTVCVHCLSVCLCVCVCV